MNSDEQRRQQVFFELHRDLPREAPGNRESTERALRLASEVSPCRRVLDVGCGPGMQTLDLADLLPDAEIVAVDMHAPYLEEVVRRAADRGCQSRVQTKRADMRALEFEPESFDLLWCEGAAYVMGVADALVAWRPLLAPGGVVALTDAVWLQDERPDSVRRFWEAGYPAMGTVADCRQIVANCGYRLLGDFVLPETAWWDDYYRPLERHIKTLVRRYAGDAVAESVLAAEREEIEMYRHHSDCYGYAFFVMVSGETP